MTNALAIFAASIVAVAACGARTGLLLVDPDAGPGGTGGVAPDAGPDVVDAGPDMVDAPPDAPPDAIVDDCADAGTTFIYLVAEDSSLYRFYPPTLSTTLLGTIKCPDTSGVNSMAVDRAGIAYVNFQDGKIFRVSTLTLSCEPTAFQPMTGVFSSTFGMAFSADISDPGEKLFVAGLGAMQKLATVDTTSFKLTTLGTFTQTLGQSELTGSGAGDLYAFGVNEGGFYLARIDKATAAVLSKAVLTLNVASQTLSDWSFAFWGGDFYFFTSTDHTTTTVSRYSPGGSLTLDVVTKIPTAIAIDGAGVSTCAPHP